MVVNERLSWVGWMPHIHRRRSWKVEECWQSVAIKASADAQASNPLRLEINTIQRKDVESSNIARSS